MIDFDRLERDLPALAERYRSAQPFPFVAIDDFCAPAALRELVDAIPAPEDAGIRKSRDYVFAKNKFEKSNFRELGPRFQEVYDDMTSDRFKAIVQKIVDAPVFIDSAFFGGGLHQGGKDSFLDMHADFSHHPERDDWLRELNILLYLNPDWKPEYGGELDLRHRDTGALGKVEPVFNRCVIMKTKDFTLHGYKKLRFPEGVYRRSIACYAYEVTDQPSSGRSTTWYPEESSLAKRMLGRSWPALVAIKSRVFGSATARNQ